MGVPCLPYDVVAMFTSDSSLRGSREGDVKDCVVGLGLDVGRGGDVEAAAIEVHGLREGDVKDCVAELGLDVGRAEAMPEYPVVRPFIGHTPLYENCNVLDIFPDIQENHIHTIPFMFNIYQIHD